MNKTLLMYNYYLFEIIPKLYSLISFLIMSLIYNIYLYIMFRIFHELYVSFHDRTNVQMVSHCNPWNNEWILIPLDYKIFDLISYINYIIS